MHHILSQGLCEICSIKTAVIAHILYIYDNNNNNYSYHHNYLKVNACLVRMLHLSVVYTKKYAVV